MALIMNREEQERNGEPQIEVYPRKDSFSVEYDRNFWKKVIKLNCTVIFSSEKQVCNTGSNLS